MNLYLKSFKRKREGDYIRIFDVFKDDDLCQVICFTESGEHVSGPSFESLAVVEREIQEGNYTPKDPLKDKITVRELSEVDLKTRDERFNLIRPLLEQDFNDCFIKHRLKERIDELLVQVNKKRLEEHQIETASLLAAGKSTNGYKPTTPYKIISYLRGYLIGAKKLNSLLTNHYKSGGAGKSRQGCDIRLGRRRIDHSELIGKILTADDRIKIAAGYKEFYNPIIRSVSSSHTEFLNKYYPDRSSTPFPSVGQFSYQGQLLTNPAAMAKKNLGQKRYDRDQRMLIGEARDNIWGVGVEAQLDSTVDNTKVISLVIPNTYLGRLTFFLLVDTFSGMPMGVCLVPDTSNYFVTSMTLICAATDKVEYCGMYDVPIKDTEWPVRGIPIKILTDLGLIATPKSDPIAELGVVCKNCESLRPDQKGIVERHIKRLLDKLKSVLDGYGLIDESVSQRTVRDPKKDAVLNYKQLMGIFLHELVYFINHIPIEGYPLDAAMASVGLYPTPLNLWNYAKENSLDCLIEDKDPDQLAALLLPKEQCTYNKNGIRFKNCFWQCESQEGRALLDQFRFGRGPATVTIKYCEVNTDMIYFVHQNQYYKCYAIGMAKHYTTLIEYEQASKDVSNQKYVHEHERIEAEIKKTNAQKEILKKAKKKIDGKLDEKNAHEAKKADKNHYRNEVTKKSTTEFQSKDDESNPLDIPEN